MRLFILCVLFIFSINCYSQSPDCLAYQVEIIDDSHLNNSIQEDIDIPVHINKSPNMETEKKDFFPVVVKETNNTDYGITSPPAGYFIFLITVSFLALIGLFWKLIVN